MLIGEKMFSMEIQESQSVGSKQFWVMAFLEAVLVESSPLKVAPLNDKKCY